MGTKMTNYKKCYWKQPGSLPKNLPAGTRFWVEGVMEPFFFTETATLDSGYGYTGSYSFKGIEHDSGLAFTEYIDWSTVPVSE